MGESTKAQPDSEYKMDHEKSKDKNNYDVTDTPQYSDQKKAIQHTSENKYKEDYNKSKGKMLGTDVLPEMEHSKKLQPVVSNKAYKEKAKMDQLSVNVSAEGQEIAHALTKQRMVSPSVYKADYNREVMGKAPEDPTIAYPEHDMHKILNFLASKPEYIKEAKQLLQTVQYDKDAKEFSQAKNAGKIANDREYKKADKDISDKYRGYQTMEAKLHPDVKKAEKANAMSDKLYKEEYEEEKSYVMFPYTITQEYEKKHAMKKANTSYTADHEETKAKNRFDVTSTPVYESQQVAVKATADIHYKEDFEKNKGKMLGTEVTPEMAKAEELKQISKQNYAKEAKKDLVKAKVGPDGQEIAHAVVMSHQASDLVYKDDFKRNVVGKGPADPAISYPEKDRLKKIHDATTKPKYEKEAKQDLQKKSLPLEAPEFVRAKEAAKNASDLNYTKQKKETVAQNRGYQTMEAKLHPDVQKAEKSKAMSDKLYKEEYEDEKSYVMFPYTITQEYEKKHAMKKADTEYHKDHEETKAKNRFDVTSTPVYESQQVAVKATADIH